MIYLLNSVSNCQQTMILQQCRLFISKTLCNIVALHLRQHYTIETVVNHVVIVESAAILCQGVNLAA